MICKFLLYWKEKKYVCKTLSYVNILPWKNVYAWNKSICLWFLNKRYSKLTKIHPEFVTFFAPLNSVKNNRPGREESPVEFLYKPALKSNEICIIVPIFELSLHGEATPASGIFISTYFLFYLHRFVHFDRGVHVSPSGLPCVCFHSGPCYLVRIHNAAAVQKMKFLLWN